MNFHNINKQRNLNIKNESYPFEGGQNYSFGSNKSESIPGFENCRNQINPSISD